MSEALKTLEKAMLIYLIYPSTGTELPILADLKKSPRLHIVDTGLVNYFAGLQVSLKLMKFKLLKEKSFIF